MKQLGFLILFFFSIYHLSAQTDSTTVKKTFIIIKNDDRQYIGQILQDDGREVLLLSSTIGKIYILKSDIKLIKEIELNEQKTIDISTLSDEFALESPFTTRYAFTTNALPIKKNVNYAMIHLYGPEIHFALSNRFSIGLMTTWIGCPMALVGKYTFPSKRKNLNFAAGTILGTSSYINQGQGYGTLSWGTVTLGDRINNFSFSAGFGTIGSFRKTNLRLGPIGSIAFIHKMGDRTSFIFDSMISFTEYGSTQYTQDWIFDSYGNYIYTSIAQPNNLVTSCFFMPGLRYQKNTKQAFQFCVAGVISSSKTSSHSFPLPMCSWFYKL